MFSNVRIVHSLTLSLSLSLSYYSRTQHTHTHTHTHTSDGRRSQSAAHRLVVVDHALVQLPQHHVHAITQLQAAALGKREEGGKGLKRILLRNRQTMKRGEETDRQTEKTQQPTRCF